MMTIDDLESTKFFDWFMYDATEPPTFEQVVEVLEEVVAHKEEYLYSGLDVIDRCVEVFNFDRLQLEVINDTFVVKYRLPLILGGKNG